MFIQQILILLYNLSKQVERLNKKQYNTMHTNTHTHNITQFILHFYRDWKFPETEFVQTGNRYKKEEKEEKVKCYWTRTPLLFLWLIFSFLSSNVLSISVIFPSHRKNKKCKITLSYWRYLKLNCFCCDCLVKKTN